jgi:hypothetical protein
MSGGDDESNSDGELMEGTTGYVFYRDRPEWKDIEPLPQDDGPNPVVKIAYTDNFQDVYDYLRAVMNKNEKSLRALHLTTDAIDCNPANYTVWHYRREILQELKMDLTEEFAFAEEIVLNEPKNYQIWYVEWAWSDKGVANLVVKVSQAEAGGMDERSVEGVETHGRHDQGRQQELPFMAAQTMGHQDLQPLGPRAILHRTALE